MGRLHAAARDGQLSEGIDLIRSGYDVNEKDKLQYTPLHYAARKGMTELVRCLLEHGADATPINDKGQTALYQAVVGGHAEITRLLVRAGANPNIAMRSGICPLHFAARAGLLDIVQILVGAGANTSQPNPQGMTAKSIAKQYKHQDIVDLLEATDAAPPSRPVSVIEEAVRRITDAQLLGEIDDDDAILAELDVIEIKAPVVQSHDGVRKPSSAGGNAPSTPRKFGGAVSKSTRRVNDPSQQHTDTHTAAHSDKPASNTAADSGDDDKTALQQHIHGGNLATELDTLIRFETKRAVAPSLPPRATVRRESASDQTTSAPQEVQPPSRAGRTEQKPPAVVTTGATYETKAPSFWTNPNKHEYESGAPSFLDGGAVRSHGTATAYVAGKSIRKISSPTTVHVAESASPAQHSLDRSLADFLRKLGLLERCGHLADEAGIVTPADFLLFTPEELVRTFRFKVGHVRKIMAVLDKD